MDNTPEQNQAAIVLTSIDSKEAATNLVRTLLDKRLIACGSITAGAKSIYRWQGKVEEAEEVLITLKTTKKLLSELEEQLYQLHSYDTPEFIVLDCSKVGVKYSKWLLENL